MSEMQNTKLADTVKTAMQKSRANGGTMTGLRSQDVGAILTQLRPQIAQALPKHLTADRIIQMATTLIVRTPAIADCSVESLVGAVMQASILGFKPVAALGECYFVPYRNNKNGKTEVQFQIGYKGYLSLARQSGEILTVYAEVVREGDFFDYELGLHPKLTHKPLAGSEALVSHVYAVVHYKSGGYNFVVLSLNEVEKYRRRSQSQRSGLSGAWQSDYDAMAKKTAIRRLVPYLPVSIDKLEQAATTDGGIIKPEHFANDQSGELNEVEEAEIIDTPQETEPEPEPVPEPEIANPMFEQPKSKK
jgi:recombination protein RecT